MSPNVFEALKRVPIQDFRLLAKPAPGETPLGYRPYDAMRLGRAPVVSVTPDCATGEEVAIAVHLNDPEQATSGDVSYPLTIDWGDGAVDTLTYDTARSANVFTHAYAAPRRYLAYVT